MRKRELINIAKQKSGWKCEFRLGRQRNLFFIDNKFNKEQVIDFVAKKFNLTNDKVEKVIK